MSKASIGVVRTMSVTARREPEELCRNVGQRPKVALAVKAAVIGIPCKRTESQ